LRRFLHGDGKDAKVAADVASASADAAIAAAAIKKELVDVAFNCGNPYYGCMVPMYPSPTTRLPFPCLRLSNQQQQQQQHPTQLQVRSSPDNIIQIIRMVMFGICRIFQSHTAKLY
jgi:hypothetical protein